MPKFNGHKNWNHWNVSLWLNGDAGLYGLARWNVENCRTLDEAATAIYEDLWGLAPLGEKPRTPDGAPYTFTSIRAAIAGIR